MVQTSVKEAKRAEKIGKFKSLKTVKIDESQLLVFEVFRTNRLGWDPMV